VGTAVQGVSTLRRCDFAEAASGCQSEKLYAPQINNSSFQNQLDGGLLTSSHFVELAIAPIAPIALMTARCMTEQTFD